MSRMTRYETSDLPLTLYHLINSGKIELGTIGIGIPLHIGTVEEQELYVTVGTVTHRQLVLIPEPSPITFPLDNPGTFVALKDRIRRDKLDAIRYNRLFVMLYPEEFTAELETHHDIYIKKDPGSREYLVFDHRKEKG